ncbi:hypothetical protein PG985_015131, partial [Apiospora marii]
VVKYPSSHGCLAQRLGQAHNQSTTRAMMGQLYDPQMARLADFDCSSEVVFKRLDDYKMFKQDTACGRRLVGDHEKFADTERSISSPSRMTIGWVEQFIDGGKVVDGVEDPVESTARLPSLALMSGSFLAGAMASLSIIAVPVFHDEARVADQLYMQWPRLSRQSYLLFLALGIASLMMCRHVGLSKRRFGRR